jgi:hypothetical protein
LISADSPWHLLEVGVVAVEVDFIVIPSDDLMRLALGAVNLPDVGTVTIHHREPLMSKR